MGTKSRKFLLPLLLLSGVAYFASPDAASERWASSFTGEYDPKLLLEEKVEQEEAASRIVQWRSFPTLMAENPIFGIGMGQYAKLVYDRGYFPKLKSAHATLIEIGVEQGLIGLICYVSLLLVIYRTASRLARQTTDPLEKSLAVALVGATVCLALLDLSGTRFRNANITAYYWILVAITLNAPTAVRRPLRAFAA